MNTDIIGNRYTRLAALALFISLSGQTVRASELAVGGAGLSLLSLVIRYAKPPISPLGMALDVGCVAVNGYAASGSTPNTVSKTFDVACFAGLFLQFTRMVPGLTWGINDPLESARTVISLVNMAIIGTRTYFNFTGQNRR